MKKDIFIRMGEQYAKSKNSCTICILAGLLYIQVVSEVSSLSNISLSSSSGPFYEYSRHCNRRYPDFSIFSASGHFQLLTSMKAKGIKEAWLPIRRQNLSEWTWLSGEPYKTTITNPDTVTRGHDCAVLWRRDGIIVDTACNQRLNQYMCESRFPCKTHTGGLHCLDMYGKAFRIFAGEGNWFHSKQACYERNSTLASFGKAHFKEIINAVRKTEGFIDKIWIGLRLTDYVYHVPNKTETDISYYVWNKDSPCACPEMLCVIIMRHSDDAVTWAAERCQASHYFPCIASGELPSADKTTSGLGGGVVAVVVISVFVVVIIAILLMFIWYRYIKRRDPKESKGPEEIETMLKGKTRKHRRKENPNVVLFGLTGTGKSSLINSLITAITPGEYREVAVPGNFGRSAEAVTWFIKRHPVHVEVGKKTNCLFGSTNVKLCFWDCPGFADDASKGTITLLQDIIEGTFDLDTPIPSVQATSGYESPKRKDAAKKTCSKMDLIIFVHDCETSVPEHLIKAVKAATRHSQKHNIPLILVINKIDKLKKEEEKLGIVTQSLSEPLGLLNHNNCIFKLSCYCKDTGFIRNKEIDGFMRKLLNDLLNRFGYSLQ